MCWYILLIDPFLWNERLTIPKISLSLMKKALGVKCVQNEEKF